jgi:hypothetical protein
MKKATTILLIILIIIVAGTALGIGVAFLARRMDADGVSERITYADALSRLVQSNWRDDYITAVELRLNDPSMTVNGSEIRIGDDSGAAPYLSPDGLIMLPVCALSQLIGCRVDFAARA